MTTRNLTKNLEKYRMEHKIHKGKGGLDFIDHDGREELLSSPDEDPEIVAASALTTKLPPTWMDIVDEIRKDMGKVREGLSTLTEFHEARLRVSFDDDEHQKQDQDIDILTRELSRLMKKCETNIKRIALQDNAKGVDLPAAERTVRLNVMRNLATELKALSKNFKGAQTKFMGALKGQNTVPGMDDGERKDHDLDDGSGYNDDHQASLEELRVRNSLRDQEINDLLKSVNELTELFSELDKLVIEQGTILDRIDYNIEQTLVKVQAGKKELVTADDYSKRSTTMKCILVLGLVMVIEIIIIIAKKR